MKRQSNRLAALCTTALALPALAGPLPETQTITELVTSPQLVGSTFVSIPDFDTMGGTRELLGVTVQASLIPTSNIRGVVRTAAPNGVETQARFFMNAEFGVTVPGGPQATLTRFYPSTVFSSNGPFTFNNAGIDISPPPSFPIQSRAPHSIFQDGGTWNAGLQWDLDTGFKIQDGPPGVWSYQHNTTRLTLRLTVAYTFQLATPPCPTDLNNSGATDLPDLNLILANFGMTTTTGDTNNDGTVDLADLNAVLAAFGTTCP